MAFKMRGWSPFKQNDNQSNEPLSHEDKVRIRKEFYEKYGPPPKAITDSSGRRTHIHHYKKDDKGQYILGPDGKPVVVKSKTQYGGKQEGDAKHSHHVSSGPIAKGSSMSPAEQQKIQKSIRKYGHFGDIDPSLVKGYGSRDSHSYRKRVAEINAHHQYLSHYDRYDKGAGKRNLQKKLGQLRNWENRYTDFTG